MVLFTLTANQILAHGIGDYLIQSDWMASEKTKSNLAAATHALSYTVPFVFLTEANWTALVAICLMHFVVDRWRLARYAVYAKNFLAPTHYWYAWSDCQKTGYHSSRPDWLTVWLMIIADNLIHLATNALAIQFLT